MDCGYYEHVDDVAMVVDIVVHVVVYVYMFMLWLLLLLLLLLLLYDDNDSAMTNRTMTHSPQQEEKEPLIRSET